MRQCLEIMLKEIDRKTPFVSLPFGVASLIGSLASLVPLIQPPITSDQVKLLKSDNVISKEAVAEGRTLLGMGIKPALVEAIIPSYMVSYRPQGQYTRTGKAA
jgi:hypothetical protein